MPGSGHPPDEMDDGTGRVRGNHGQWCADFRRGSGTLRRDHLHGGGGGVRDDYDGFSFAAEKVLEVMVRKLLSQKLFVVYFYLAKRLIRK